MECQFCRKICEDIHAMQLHQVTSCPAIEDGDRFVEEEKVEVTFKWIKDRSISAPSVYLIGSDMDNNIELKQEYGECFRSGKMRTSTGNY